jgi:hypothetical protein
MANHLVVDHEAISPRQPRVSIRFEAGCSSGSRCPSAQNSLRFPKHFGVVHPELKRMMPACPEDCSELLKTPIAAKAANLSQAGFEPATLRLTGELSCRTAEGGPMFMGSPRSHEGAKRRFRWKRKPCGNPDSINLLLHATQEGLTRQSTITPVWLARGRPIVIGAGSASVCSTASARNNPGRVAARPYTPL